MICEVELICSEIAVGKVFVFVVEVQHPTEIFERVKSLRESMVNLHVYCEKLEFVSLILDTFGGYFSDIREMNEYGWHSLTADCILTINIDDMCMNGFRLIKYGDDATFYTEIDDTCAYNWRTDEEYNDYANSFGGE